MSLLSTGGTDNGPARVAEVNANKASIWNGVVACTGADAGTKRASSIANCSAANVKTGVVVDDVTGTLTPSVAMPTVGNGNICLNTAMPWEINLSAGTNLAVEGLATAISFTGASQPSGITLSLPDCDSFTWQMGMFTLSFTSGITVDGCTMTAAQEVDFLTAIAGDIPSPGGGTINMAGTNAVPNAAGLALISALLEPGGWATINYNA